MIKHKTINKKIIVIALAVLLLVCAGTGYGLWQKHANDDEKTNKPIGLGEVNYDPPTAADKKETEQHKQDLEKQADAENNSTSAASTTNSSTTAKKATVVATYLSATEARGYVSNILEDGGTCTVTLTKGSAKVTATSTGFADVNKTTCSPMAIDQSQLSSGQWTAVLSYSSSAASGTSASQTINVP